MSIKETMNTHLHNACVHLINAAKCLTEVGADEAAHGILSMADQILAMMDAPPQRVSKERMDELLSDIMGSDS
jgi:hypothetical protein